MSLCTSDFTCNLRLDEFVYATACRSNFYVVTFLVTINTGSPRFNDLKL